MNVQALDRNLAIAHPTTRVHPSRVVVNSGTDDRIITAGGGFSWLDLAVYLVARFFGRVFVSEIALHGDPGPVHQGAHAVRS
jgi:transcriptional regulator GlxA family with amidase domain